MGALKSSVADLYGILSLMFWALMMVVTVKYLTFIMRADHDGEGGVFALLAILPKRFRTSAAENGKVTGMALLAVIGASLLYGDGVITPAISVLSAVEGLAVASPRLTQLVLPLTCGILIALFSIQRRGTGDVGKLFGPVMVVWFATMASLGIFQILHKPEILGAFPSPWSAVLLAPRDQGDAHSRLRGSGRDRRRGALCGHGAFWSQADPPCVVVLRDAGVGFGLPRSGPTVLLRIPSAHDNPFYKMVPPGAATYALVALSSCATVIASQALISGAFSLTRQAMLLGYLPRVTIKHTAYQTEGQIYIPEVNSLLGIGCILLVLTFRESVKLAAAYGIAVTGTMAITSLLYYIVIRYSWGWNKWKCLGLLLLFLAFDIPFLIANLFKFFEGGYVPMLIGAALIAGMLIWSRGRTALIEQYSTRYPTLEDARPSIAKALCSRVPGTAVFIAPSPEHVPPILVHHVERSKSLHEKVVLLTVLSTTIPEVPESERYEIHDLGDGFYKLIVSFGYMEDPLLLPVLEWISANDASHLDFENATYYIGHETIVAGDAGRINRIPEAIFAYLNRNAVHEERRYGMPPDQIVEIGAQIDL